MSYDPETYWPARYQRQGETYVARGGRRDSFDAQVEAIAPYFEHLPTEGRVLDFGCGPGRFRPALEAHGLAYEGVDLIDGLGTMEAGNIAPQSFDAAVAIFVLQHIVDEDEYREAVDRVYTALTKGGRLLVVDHAADHTGAQHMNPRGPEALADARPWSAAEYIGVYDGHWIGLFTK